MGQIQFSTRTLLAAVAAVGIGAALWTAEPSWYVGTVEVVFLGWLFALTIMLSIHANGRAKAWWVGVAAGFTLITFLYFEIFGSLVSIFTDDSVLAFEIPLGVLEWLARIFSSNFRPLVTALALAPVVGLLSVFTHWLLIRPPEPKA